MACRTRVTNQISPNLYGMPGPITLLQATSSDYQSRKILLHCARLNQSNFPQFNHCSIELLISPCVALDIFWPLIKIVQQEQSVKFNS